MTETGKKKGAFAKIENREDAIKAVKDASMAFFFIAALQIGLSFILGASILIDAAIYAVGGLFLRWLNSRVTAVILLLITLVSVGVTFGNMLGAKLGGGSNLIVALILLWASIRAVEATFKLHGRFAADATSGEPRAPGV